MQVPLPAPKYGFSAVVGEQVLSFGPYDTEYRAAEIRLKMVRFVECSEVMPLHTCGSASQLIKAFEGGWRPDSPPKHVRQKPPSAPQVEAYDGVMISRDEPQRMALPRAYPESERGLRGAFRRMLER